MRFLLTLLATAAITVFGAPLQDFDVTVSSSGPSDVLCHTVSLYPSGVSSTGISTVLDDSRGYAWERLSTANANAGLRVTDSKIGKSYTKAAWVNFDSLTGFPMIIASIPNTNTPSDETGSHMFWVGPGGFLNAAHNVDSTAATRWNCDEALGGPGSLPVNQWVHVAVTYDGSTGDMVIYRNGTRTSSGSPRACGYGQFVNSVETTDSRDNWNGSPVDSLIGNWYGMGLKGRIQDVQQYDIALTQAHIQQIVAQPLN